MSEPLAGALQGTDEPEPKAPDWRVNAAFFTATLGTVFWVGGEAWTQSHAWEGVGWLTRFLGGWSFAVPLLAILLFHEFGHYIAARLHRVPASLPYFIPLPVAVGTLGAVISMPSRIRSRNALLDIGAAGPLAGLVVAIPVLLYGLSLSKLGPLEEGFYQMEGQSLLYLALKYVAVGPIPEGHDVALHPTAVAGWVGLFLTMLNLVPFGQLDGGHISYALLGSKSSTVSRVVRFALLGWFGIELVRALLPLLSGTSHLTFWMALMNAAPWLTWFGLLSLLKRLQGGYDHPPTDDHELSRGRRVVGWGCLLLFVLLFMPTPMSVHWHGP
jgi:membrane-associated protease RseP (regulator of RpoE activity)